jgi:hypothetical protein
MALTQMQIIQSLGEAMAWFEREISWGVPPTELRHLCGRIGELYAALITNGQMATEVNQKGYDVVSAEGERISVKTTASMGNKTTISFNINTLIYVDRVIVLRINTEEMQIETILNEPIAEAKKHMTPENNNKCTLSMSRLATNPSFRENIPSIKEVKFNEYTIRELETGTIEVEYNNNNITPAKPVLRNIATQLNIGIINSNGNAFNTRQLGSQIIKTIQERFTTDF